MSQSDGNSLSHDLLVVCVKAARAGFALRTGLPSGQRRRGLAQWRQSFASHWIFAQIPALAGRIALPDRRAPTGGGLPLPAMARHLQ
ncbi:hypothetical protein [Tritonibacter horizontis]|uniref:hypothetical protein n=1 Tax=Tritonibacter horizontis TaxID=1768241 RepID=UPI001042344D|nr:hypothetical protein [Tritonibacter horizontis]